MSEKWDRLNPSSKPPEGFTPVFEKCCCCGKQATTEIEGVEFTPLCQRCKDEVTMLREKKGTPASEHVPALGGRKDL